METPPAEIAGGAWCTCTGRGVSGALAHVEQRVEQARIEAVAGEGLALGQDADRVVAVQAFLVAGDDAEIADPRIALQLLAEQPRGVLDKDRVGGVQFGKGLFILALDHHLRLGRAPRRGTSRSGPRTTGNPRPRPERPKRARPSAANAVWPAGRGPGGHVRDSSSEQGQVEE